MTNVDDDRTLDVTTRLGSLRVRSVAATSGSDAGAGAMPCVLWHSLFVDSTSWDRMVDGLARYRRLILIDAPSHGASAPAHRRFTLGDCADAAGDVLDHLEVRSPVDWVGNAWGGHVGIMVAASKTSRVRSLIAIGTPVRALTPAERRRIVPLVAAYRLLGPISPLVSGVQDALLGRGADAQDARVVSAALRRAQRKGMYTAMRSIMLARPDLAPVLPTVTTPTLFVCANDDPYGRPAETRDAAKLLARGTFNTIAGGGHVAPLLQSAPELAQMITDFWQTVDAA
jgi:pimeloyl-ACP methyl ester carboxylesterase